MTHKSAFLVSFKKDTIEPSHAAETEEKQNLVHVIWQEYTCQDKVIVNQIESRSEIQQRIFGSTSLQREGEH